MMKPRFRPSYGIGPELTLAPLTAPEEEEEGDPPGVPSLSMNAASTTSILVEVTADGFETEVYFEHTASSGDYPGTELALTGGPGIWTGTIEGLSPNSYAYGHAKAINPDGESAFCSEISSATYGPPTPATNLQVTGVTETTISISWSPGSGSSSTLVEWSRAGELNWSSANVDSGGPSGTTISNLDPGTSYDIHVVETNEHGNADPANVNQSTVLP